MYVYFLCHPVLNRLNCPPSWPSETEICLPMPAAPTTSGTVIGQLHVSGSFANDAVLTTTAGARDDILPSRRGVVIVPLLQALPHSLLCHAPVPPPSGTAIGQLLYHPALQAPPPPGLAVPAYILKSIAGMSPSSATRDTFWIPHSLVVSPFSSLLNKPAFLASPPSVDQQESNLDYMLYHGLRLDVVPTPPGLPMLPHNRRPFQSRNAKFYIILKFFHYIPTLWEAQANDVTIIHPIILNLFYHFSECCGVEEEATVQQGISDDVLECARADKDDSFCSTESVGDDSLAEDAVIVLPKGGHLQEGDPNWPRNPFLRTEEIVGLFSDLAVNEKPSSTQFSAADYANSDDEYLRVLEQLQQQERQKDHEALSMRTSDGKVDPSKFISGGVTIDEEDIDSLRPCMPLTDNVVNAFMSLLESRSKASMSSPAPLLDFVALSSAYFTYATSDDVWRDLLTWTEGIDDFLTKMFLLPCCHQGHWTLLCLDMEESSMTLFDSSNAAQVEPAYLKQVVRWLQSEEKRRGRPPSNWNVFVAEVPQQRPQSNDCGLYVIGFAEGLTRGRIVNRVNTDRSRLMTILRKGEIPICDD